MKDFIGLIYDPLAFRAKRILYAKIIPPIVDNRIGIIRLARNTIKICILLGLLCLLISIGFNHAKMINSAGLLFDFAGIARIFISDEWDDLLSHYGDIEKYPFGPPSHITREMFKDDDPEIFLDKNGKYGERPSSQHLYYNRGLFLLAVGFILQLVSTLIG